MGRRAYDTLLGLLRKTYKYSPFISYINRVPCLGSIESWLVFAYASCASGFLTARKIPDFRRFSNFSRAVNRQQVDFSPSIVSVLS